MEMLSEDGKCTITRWSAERFWWRDEDGKVGKLGALEQERWGGRLIVSTKGIPFMPPEAVRWLGGERTPPEPPIKVGDKVEWAIGSGVVRAITQGWAWVSIAGFDAGYVKAVDELRRVS